ncbi:MAG: GNAT family N-acetyltransferase [Thermomicrobiales bacterium]
MEQPTYPTLIAVPEELRSSRVVLRPCRLADADALYAAVVESRDRLARWLPWATLYTSVDVARDFCQRTAANWLLRADLPYGIFAAHDGAFLGGTGLHRFDWQARTFEIGYWVRRSAEGYGYVGEAIRLLATMAFTHLAAQRVQIVCDARNDRSRHTAERASFVLEGRLRNDRLGADGQPRDTLVFSLIPQDFARLRQSWQDDLAGC